MGHELSRMPSILALNRIFAACGNAALSRRPIPRPPMQWRTGLGVAAVAAIVSVVVLGATILPAKAQFTALYGFGDSYADTGAAPGGAFRLAGVTACINNPSSCRFTGGTNFVETLQSIYGLPGLTNYAIGGALTDNSNTLTAGLGVAVPPLAGFPYELARLAYDGVRFKSTDLVTVSIGGNDSSPSRKTMLRSPPRSGWRRRGGP